jgi:hypothetical protein
MKRSTLFILFSLIFAGACTEAELAPVSPAEQVENQQELTLLELEHKLRASVQHLAGTIGERNLAHPENLQQAADWIVGQWELQGLEPKIHTYTINGKPCHNIEVDVSRSKDGPVVVIGAHYDSAEGTPGADDNASGVASMLEISRALAGEDFKHTVRCVAFVNEEPPYFSTYDMGSQVYAKMIRERGDQVVQMISIESVGYFSDAEGSQNYPSPLAESYPSVGNFLGVVSDLKNGMGVGTVSKHLRDAGPLPIESAVLPSGLPGVDWSDHASFWMYDYPAVMVTDTAPFRNNNYHDESDTPATLDFVRHAQATAALIQTTRKLAQPSPGL